MDRARFEVQLFTCAVWACESSKNGSIATYWMTLHPLLIRLSPLHSLWLIQQESSCLNQNCLNF